MDDVKKSKVRVGEFRFRTLLTLVFCAKGRGGGLRNFNFQRLERTRTNNGILSLSEKSWSINFGESRALRAEEGALIDENAKTLRVKQQLSSSLTINSSKANHHALRS